MNTAMKKTKEGYGRFYALLKDHPLADKNELVLTYTGGRTTHLREMKPWEYREMCNALDNNDTSAFKTQLKQARSNVLLRLARLGISTVDNWDEINAFCLSPKIAGKEFRELTLQELRALVPKLEAIIRKGGLKPLEEPGQEPESGKPAAKQSIPIYINPSTIKS